MANVVRMKVVCVLHCLVAEELWYTVFELLYNSISWCLQLLNFVKTHYAVTLC